MKRTLKKLTAITITVILLLTLAQTALATTIAPLTQPTPVPLDTTLTLNSILTSTDTAQDPRYLPLRMIFESSGAEVGWDGPNARIPIELDGKEIEYTIGSAQAKMGGETVTLNYPVVRIQGRAHISYADAEFLFVREPGKFEETIMATVVTSFQMMNALSLPGISVAIVDTDTGFTWTQGFGFADIENEVYVNENSVYSVGSISKTLTAIAIMQLVEEGKINLDTPVVNYLPNFSTEPSTMFGGDSGKITPRMLLTHTSGILSNFLGYNSLTARVTNKDFLNNFLELLSEYPMMTSENEMFVYNNNGYNILGILIASLTGNNNFFDDFVSYQNENIFAPLGMSSSSFVLNNALTQNLAKPYADATKLDTLALMNSIPTGGMFSTAYDMALLMQILLEDDGKLVNPGTIAEMMKPHDIDISTTMGAAEYGLGFLRVTADDGFSYVGHNGAAIHYYTEMALDPDSGIGIFIATNSITGLGVPTSMGGALLQTAVMEKTGTLNLAPTRANPLATPIEMAPEQLAPYAGLYIGNMDYFLVDLDDSGSLNLVITLVPGIPPLPLTPLSDGSFNSVLGRLWFDLVIEDGEEYVLLRVGDMGTAIIGVQAEKEDYIATDELTPWLGSFTPRPRSGEVSLVSAITFATDDAGIAYIQTAQIMGVAPISPISMETEAWDEGIENITYSTDGTVVSFEMLGMRFTR